jgi:hypothetical protein
MYARLPTEQELTGTGFTVADYEEEAEVWPENWPVFRFFLMMQTQWDVGMAGRTGLKYQVLFDLMDRQQLSGDEWQEMFDDIRAMEAAALNAMHEE